jgi:ribosomal protein S18 acetylase RimI-like enzyme
MASSFPIRSLAPGEADACEAILRSLPEWFGIEEAIVQYRRDLEVMDVFVAESQTEIVGFLALRRHNEYSAEIHVIAIRGEYHRRGIGRALIRHVETLLRYESTEFLAVKTLGPSRENEAYARTRSFYAALGFRPLEETSLWGEGNPCLIMVKHLKH